ncbi:hypothetical protein [Hyalangium versicolor]|uniref:hypothetical protein n=1 Tax=Hyalangium versicolor TaxID=2861190 RepID=UPI001CCAB3A3|nr:hypothetical protein [Hyalangium versicolor]
MLSAELIASVTEASLPEIERALSDAHRAVFVREVLGFEVSRRLGELDYVVSLGDPRESRLPPEWKRSLQLVANHYLSRAEPHVSQELELAEVLRGWRHFQPAAHLLVEPLRAAIHAQTELVRQELLQSLSSQRHVPWTWLWGEVRPLFRSGRREDGSFGLAILRAATGGIERLRGRAGAQVMESVLRTLAHASEEQLDAVGIAAGQVATGHSQDLLALLAGPLGLVPEILPLLFEQQKHRHHREGALGFLGELGEAASDAAPRLLEMLTVPEAGDRKRLFRILGQVGASVPQVLAFLQERLAAGDFTERQAALATLLMLHRAERIAWSETLAQQGLTVVRDALDRNQHTWLITTLEGVPVDWRRRILPGLEELESVFLARFVEQSGALSTLGALPPEPLGRLLREAPRLRARFLDHARTHPNDPTTDAFLEAVGPETPEVLLLVQHRLHERDGHPWNRQRAVHLLGRLVGEHSSPAEPLLLSLFLDEREDTSTRVAAAQGLVPAIGRLQERAPMVESALRDESALIRGWAYLLLGENREKHAPGLARDPSPAVRQLVADLHPLLPFLPPL